MRRHRLLLSLAVSVLACRPQPAPVTSRSDVVVLPEAQPEHGQPGFVLYTRAVTVLVPFDGSAPRQLPGLWLLDEQASPPRVEHWDDEEENEDGDLVEECEGDEGHERVSLVGGVLYLLGWTWNGACNGMNLYDSYSDTRRFATPEPTEATEPLDRSAMKTLGCSADLMPAEVTPPWPIVLDDLDCRDDDDDCDSCDDEYAEAEILLLRRGALWQVADNTHHAGGTRWVSRMPVDPDHCPGPADPCGPQLPFAKAIAHHAEFWIDTDGRAALLATAERYDLWRLAETSPSAFTLPGVDASRDLIGVRVHDDLGPLLRAIAHDGAVVDE
ncbi:MAG: hypothetical protein KC457_05490 [Myxococcales bacterium]|nr:hypothetical protein [Myxococcales bacterium]